MGVILPPLTEKTAILKKKKSSAQLEYIDSDASYCMPELGAEVVVLDEADVHMADQEEEEQVLLRTNNKVEYSRRVSYEEMVHQDSDCDSDIGEQDAEEEEDDSESPTAKPPSLQDCLAVLTRWALDLQVCHVNYQRVGRKQLCCYAQVDSSFKTFSD